MQTETTTATNTMDLYVFMDALEMLALKLFPPSKD